MASIAASSAIKSAEAGRTALLVSDLAMSCCPESLHDVYVLLQAQKSAVDDDCGTLGFAQLAVSHSQDRCACPSMFGRRFGPIDVFKSRMHDLVSPKYDREDPTYQAAQFAGHSCANDDAFVDVFPDVGEGVAIDISAIKALWGRKQFAVVFAVWAVSAGHARMLSELQIAGE